MNKAKIGLAILAAVSLFGFATAWAEGPGPDATVRDAYAVTLMQLATMGGGKHTTKPPWRPPHRQKLMSEHLNKLFERDEKFMEESGDIGNLEYDPFTNSQDGDVTRLNISVGSQKDGQAVVFADFVSNRQPVRVEFSMIRENGRWVVDDISSATDGTTDRVGQLLSRPYGCGSFMNKPCKR